MQTLFWVSVFGVAYSYFVYPALLLLVRRNVLFNGAANDWPSVSVIVTAHNEAAQIEQKLRNTLSIDYPRDRFEIIVASDASTDDTDRIVQAFESRGVRLVRAAERRGKEYAQWLAILAAAGDILVFSDVATSIPEQAVRHLSVRFADPRIGAISSEDRFTSEGGGIIGEGAYVKYEMWLRRLESSVNSLVGLSGSFFAARKLVCQDWKINIPSDFNTAVNCVRRGMIAVSDPKVCGYYKGIKDETKEYQRKLRTVIRGISALVAQPDVLNPLQFGFFSFQVFSHKIMRWLVPWFMILLFVSASALVKYHWIYGIVFLGQVAFYVLSLLGLVLTKTRRNVWVKIPFFFMQANVAILHATMDYMLGRRVTVWNPTKR